LPNGDIFVSGVPCALECVFCVEGIAKRARSRTYSRLRAKPESMSERIPRPLRGSLRALRQRLSVMLGGSSVEVLLRELDAALGQTPAEEVVLAAHDILEMDGLFEALELCARHGKRVALISPGLRLADQGFARRLARRVSRLTITFLSDDPGTYHRMTGLASAHALVRRAIENLVALDVPLDVNCVVTSMNVQDLSGVATFLLEEMSLESFNIVGMVLERRHLEMDPDAVDLIAPYPMLDAELLQITCRCQGGPKRLALVNVPPCRLSEEVLQSGTVELTPFGAAGDAAPRHSDERCAGCPYLEACPRVFEAYHQRHPRERANVELVRRLAPRLLGQQRCPR